MGYPAAEDMIFEGYGRKVWRGPTGIMSVLAATMMSMSFYPSHSDPNMETLVSHLLIHMRRSQQVFAVPWMEDLVTLGDIHAHFMEDAALQTNFWNQELVTVHPTVLYALAGYLKCSITVINGETLEKRKYWPMRTPALESAVLLDLHGVYWGTVPSKSRPERAVESGAMIEGRRWDEDGPPLPPPWLFSGQGRWDWGDHAEDIEMERWGSTGDLNVGTLNINGLTDLKLDFLLHFMGRYGVDILLSLIHISEPTRPY